MRSAHVTAQPDVVLVFFSEMGAHKNIPCVSGADLPMLRPPLHFDGRLVSLSRIKFIASVLRDQG